MMDRLLRPTMLWLLPARHGQDIQFLTPYVQGIDKVVKVDAQTVDVILKSPNPVLLRPDDRTAHDE